MTKIKYQLEIPIHASPSMLYQYISSPSSMEEWFADRVNAKGKIITFEWDGVEEKAQVISKKTGEKIKYKWLESDDDESYFEIRIQVDALTKDVSIVVEDFAEEDEVEESKQLWESQIDELKSTIGA